MTVWFCSAGGRRAHRLLLLLTGMPASSPPPPPHLQVANARSEYCRTRLQRTA